MERDISVSVIIPVYNIEEELLRRCVGSAAGQTYDRLEIILVDDGSDESTAACVDTLAEELDDRFTASGEGGKSVRVIHKLNGGSSSARNAGLKLATGDYVCFIDCDDYVDPDYVSRMAEAIVRLGLPMAQISRDEIAPDGSRLPDVCIPPESEYIITGREQLRELLLHRGDCSFCTRLTDRRLFEGREFPEGKLNEDFRLLVSMLPDIDSYVILPRQAYHVYYRIGSNSRSADRDSFKPVYRDIVDNADYAEEMVRAHYPKLKNEAARFALYQRLDYLLHVPIGMMNKDNDFYIGVVRYIRGHISGILFNRYLSAKDRLYLMLFAINPSGIRRLHARLRNIG